MKNQFCKLFNITKGKIEYQVLLTQVHTEEGATILDVKTLSNDNEFTNRIYCKTEEKLQEQFASYELKQANDFLESIFAYGG